MSSPSILPNMESYNVFGEKTLVHVTIFIATTLFVYVAHWIYRWNNPRCKGNLPPGSMGFPLIGETLKLFTPSNTAFDLHPFISHRLKRYGVIFRTSLAGCPIVVSADPEFNQLVFQQEGKQFKSWWPDSFVKIFGETNIGEQHGLVFRYLKNTVLRLFGPESLKDFLLHDVEKTARTRLNSWSAQSSVEIREAVSTMIFNLTANKLFSFESSELLDDLRKNFFAFTRGLVSFPPLEIPGTAFHQCMKGRRNAMKVLKNIMKERLNSSGVQHGDLFDYVIEEIRNEESVMTEDMALNLMFAILFASYDTTTQAITMAMKLLTEHPRVLEELTLEHERILKNKDNPESGITWSEYKSMSFTFQVINETVRLANIAPVIFRKAIYDVEYKGYSIPAGWGVLVCSAAVHLNADIYDDPLSFNPWRWKDIPVNRGSKHFMAFGGGIRFCAGADFSRLQMAIFLHHLVTNYRWKFIKGGDILRLPALDFPNGFHIQLLPKA